jgi:hypothetical protein
MILGHLLIGSTSRCGIDVLVRSNIIILVDPYLLIKLKLRDNYA